VQSPHAGAALLGPAWISSTKKRASEKIRKANLHVCDLNSNRFLVTIQEADLQISFSTFPFSLFLDFRRSNPAGFSNEA
jgi:hypothetical protein